MTNTNAKIVYGEGRITVSEQSIVVYVVVALIRRNVGASDCYTVKLDGVRNKGSRFGVSGRS